MGGDDQSIEEASFNFLNALTDGSFTDVLPHIYLCKNEIAFRHLFRVASGLDSMIIGEFEILGQVRRALETAEKTRMVNLPLRNLFRHAIVTGRRAREETEISKNAISISSVAVDLVTGIIGDLANCKILIIGAGEAGRLVAKAARERGASQIIVASRSEKSSQVLAAVLGASWVTINNMGSKLATSDVVISCTGAPRFILEQHQVEAAMRVRSERPLVIVDIAVPRDVEPGVKQINNVFLYGIDDLIETSTLNYKQREREIQKVTQIVKSELDKFITWWQALEIRPVVSALMQKAEDIRQGQLDLTIKKLRELSDEEIASLEAMTKAIVTKMLNNPIQYLKKTGYGRNDYAQIVNELFQLNVSDPE
tara:strand:- start:531 stop:1631 length:1101 start_codon:yes stop_codon:yes gene_type:complete